MKKIYALYLFLAVFSLASCEKENPTPIDPKTADLTGGPWTLEDAVVKVNYSFMGQSILDSTFSVFAGSPACEKDFSFSFKTDKNMDIKTGTSYCGDPLPGTAYKWEEKNSFDRLLIIGKDAGGIMVNTRTNTSTTISDTLNLKVLSISGPNLTAVYEVPISQMFSLLGEAEDMEDMEELFELFGQLVSGKMEITYKMKRK